MRGRAQQEALNNEKADAMNPKDMTYGAVATDGYRAKLDAVALTEDDADFLADVEAGLVEGLSDAAVHGTGRRLMDMFGDSLKFVDRLMNEKFGHHPRKVWGLGGREGWEEG